MNKEYERVFEAVSGRKAFFLALECFFIGLWQFLHTMLQRLQLLYVDYLIGNHTIEQPPTELTVHPALGVHCYIKIKDAKYHYIKTGPKSGQLVLIMGDAPDVKIWEPSWARVVTKLADSGHHVVTLHLRGTGGSDGGSQSALSPPQIVEELATLLKLFGVSKKKPAIVIGFGIGGMLTWYLLHCEGFLISKYVIVNTPHPNLYWEYPPAPFCSGILHFIQWPHFPENWLAFSESERKEKKWANTRSHDWNGALNYIRGAAWWRIQSDQLIVSRGLVIGGPESADQIKRSSVICLQRALRLIAKPEPGDAEFQELVLDFIAGRLKHRADPLLGKDFL